MRARSWRDERTPIAFLVAPLAVPLLIGIQTAYHTLANDAALHTELFLILLGTVALVAYGGVIIFGIPAYLLLRARKLTAFWLAPAIGFIVGAMVHAASFAFIVPSMPPANMLLGAVKFGGPLGAVVGAILWLIARPDRQTQ